VLDDLFPVLPDDLDERPVEHHLPVHAAACSRDR
jgi:hypothetical protein